MRVLLGRVPSSIIGSQGLTSDDAMGKSTMSKVLVVLEGHGEDDEDSS